MEQSATGGQALTLANPWWEVTVGLGSEPGPSRVVDRSNGLLVADAPYCYALDVLTGPLRLACRGLVEVTHRQIAHDGGAQSVVLEGRLDFGKGGPTDLHLCQRITLPGDAPW